MNTLIMPAAAARFNHVIAFDVSKASLIAVRLISEYIYPVIDLHNIVLEAASGKDFIYRHFLKEGDRKDLEQCAEGGVEIEPFFDDGDEDAD